MTRAVSLAELLDPRRARELVVGRITGGAAEAAAESLGRCAARLHALDVETTAPVRAWFVPGRIEVLGKHTDYAGGRSLLAAVERGIHIIAVPRFEGVVTVSDARSGESCRLPIDAELRVPPGWAAYPGAVVRRIARNFPGSLGGASLAFESSLPPAAGMSSSSALIVATFLALAAVAGLPATEGYRVRIRTPGDLAEYLAALESGADFRDLSGGLGVGTLGGSQDHTAILCARANELVQYAFRPVRFERSLPFPPGCIFVIVASGVTAEKIGAARDRYNTAAREMQRIAELWRHATGRQSESVGEALAADPAAVERIREIVRTASGSLLARFDQFVEESEVIIPEAGDALASGYLERFGRLADRSQTLAEGALRNQVPETAELARLAREHGAVAASAFGAGFGGSVWALVRERESAAFLERWRSAYLERFPQHAASAGFFVTRPGSPAQRLI